MESTTPTEAKTNIEKNTDYHKRAPTLQSKSVVKRNLERVVGEIVIVKQMSCSLHQFMQSFNTRKRLNGRGKDRFSIVSNSNEIFLNLLNLKLVSIEILCFEEKKCDRFK